MPDRSDSFSKRHIGPDATERREMLSVLGVETLDALIVEVIPAAIRCEASSNRPARTEPQALARLRELASKNTVARSFIGAGYHACHTPSVIRRNVLNNPAWYTAYTPYQPEISQGRLEALLNFQTMVSDLTALPIANASLLDEATAAAEAMAMCYRITKGRARRFVVSGDTHPQTLAVLQTRAQPLDVELVIHDPEQPLPTEQIFGALFQYPGTSGEVRDLRPAIQRVHDAGGLAVVAADLLSLTMLLPPGEMQADIAIGTTQRFGVPMFFGGPHAAYFATREEHKRAIPGRLIGVSVDAHQNRAYRMALQTREQHIRRDRATSNICTAQALLAIIAGLYGAYHGAEGLRAMARCVHHLTSVLALGLDRLGFAVQNERWFDTVTVRTGDKTDVIHSAATAAGINFRHFDDGRIGVALDEATTPSDVDRILSCFAGGTGESPTYDQLHSADLLELDSELLRQSDFLTHPVFRSYRTETKMMRYLRALADKDLALDRTMIPLGSCTMKLNAATEMEPVTWPEFADIHPHAPADQTEGYAELISELEQMLCEATGYDAVSLQPNAGSQGEFAGLLAIRAYHEERGESNRNVCLIPESAHGTNPASATMAGMKVIVVKCDGQGNVDLEDLRSKADQHSSDLAAMMITYPSTHGVFEESVSELCKIVHDRGGQVYIDGANLNAQVGLCQPGKYGGDVSHLNLHKTFCIPHGGGGPGVGPVAVKEHLAKFLPGSALVRDESGGVGPVSAAPWGSAGILPISWAYIYMMGDDGLRKASEIAILNANYIATRLAAYYPILYRGSHGRVAHECILDVRPLQSAAGVTVDDIAKRLIDYGFHAPTMSFPVAGTFMIEPTESESKAELDRFCDAMIQIREEIQSIEDGLWDREDNPLKQSPHTARAVASDDWLNSYSRQTAAYPSNAQQNQKYWPPVGRIDHAYGDRNLICACPSIEELAEQAPAEKANSTTNDRLSAASS